MIIVLKVVDIHNGDWSSLPSSCERLEKVFDTPSHFNGLTIINIHHMITLMEAYNNGTLLQYIMDICCNPTYSSAKVDTTNDYETNWNGHQPLSPMKTTCSKKEEDASSCRLSASELRFDRKRRRRGVISPRDNTTDSTKQVNNYDTNRCIIVQNNPKDVIHPHYNNKSEKWQSSV